MSLLAVLLGSLPTVHAVPVKLNQQGRLLDLAAHMHYRVLERGGRGEVEVAVLVRRVGESSTWGKSSDKGPSGVGRFRIEDGFDRQPERSGLDMPVYEFRADRIA